VKRDDGAKTKKQTKEEGWVRQGASEKLKASQKNRAKQNRREEKKIYQKLHPKLGNDNTVLRDSLGPLTQGQNKREKAEKRENRGSIGWVDKHAPRGSGGGDRNAASSKVELEHRQHLKT